MFEQLVPRILERYQIDYENILAAQKGYRNSSSPISLKSGEMANLVLYKSEPGMETRIRRTNEVSNFLAFCNLPARHTLDKRIIRLSSKEFTMYGSIYNYLPGDTISWEAYTKNHLKLTGMMMSTMHSNLANMAPVENNVADEYAGIVRRMRHYFVQAPVKKAILKKLKLKLEPDTFDNFEALLRLSRALPLQQTLHMDFVRGNLLFDSPGKTSPYMVGKVAMTGIIDFEKTASGHPIFDIARTLAFLLVDCKYKSEQKIRKYFLVSGYSKRGSTKFKNIHMTYQSQKIDLLEQLVNLFLVYDLYKFLRHNPYEFLEQNQHFVRTRDILIRRNMIKCIN
jgi:Ser/Thr protein kinase RdoA (MazF antagonist)